MFLKLLKRAPRRLLLIEFNPYQILVAEIFRPRHGEAVIEAAAEFDREDVAGFGAWVESRTSKGRLSVLCSLVPVRAIVQRESIQPALQSEPGYLEEIIQEQQKGRFLTATPFKVVKEGTWTFRTVDAVEGAALPATGHARPALICALANREVLEAQRRLLVHRLTREWIEPGILSLFGATYATLRQRGSLRAVVIVVMLENATAVYVLGKEGVHTPNPVLHGFNSILELGRKEFGVIEDAEVLSLLEAGAPATVAAGGKLVRRIARDLKPVIDSFEMTTGQPVDEVLCAYLPPKLAWLAEPLAQGTGREPLTLDCQAWLPTARLQVVPDIPAFGPQWLGALNVAANLPEIFARRAALGRGAYVRPWHVDCDVPLDADERELRARRTLTVIAVGAVAALALAAAAWQAYALGSLRRDTAFWEQQLAGNQKLFEELNTASASLKKQTAVLDRAYDLMAEPFQLSEFLVALGRTVPPRMQVERIDSSDQRVAIAGVLSEPAEEASTTLGRYMETLRRDPGIGPLFANIAITTLQRRGTGDELQFELTLRLRRPTP